MMTSTPDSCKDGASKSSDNDDDVPGVENMRTAKGKDVKVSVCANCGKEGYSDLKSCTACKLVKYCNRDCQIAHRPQHKKACRKRAAELYDEKLFKQPPQLLRDCPICFLLLPTLNSGRRYQSCCGKVICCGCAYAPVYDNQGNEVADKKCAYCRTPSPYTDEEIIKRDKKRAEAGDAEAMFNVGNHYRAERDIDKALELWYRAAKHGNTEAYVCIGVEYYFGRNVEVDKEKAKHYYELAAIGGNTVARHYLGNMEGAAGNFDRAMKHHMIAVKSGEADSLEMIKDMYSKGYATKEDYTKALRAYQEYLGEIKSDQRDKAAATYDYEDCRYY